MGLTKEGKFWFIQLPVTMLLILGGLAAVAFLETKWSFLVPIGILVLLIIAAIPNDEKRKKKEEGNGQK